MSGSNFGNLVKLQRYPRNIQYFPACPVGLADRTGVVEIFAFLELEPRLNIKKDLTGQPDKPRLRKLPFFKGLFKKDKNSKEV
jgi:hypothetical protein